MDSHRCMLHAYRHTACRQLRRSHRACAVSRALRSAASTLLLVWQRWPTSVLALVVDVPRPFAVGHCREWNAWPTRAWRISPTCYDWTRCRGTRRGTNRS